MLGAERKRNSWQLARKKVLSAEGKRSAECWVLSENGIVGSWQGGGFGVLGAGCWVLGAGCWVLGALSEDDEGGSGQLAALEILSGADCLLPTAYYGIRRPKRADPYLAKSARGWKKRPK